jgi:hypothetical protein
MQLRFPLRWLLFLTALAGATCLWQFAMPTIIAERFRAAIAQSDYAAADGMCVDSTGNALASMVNQFQDEPGGAIEAHVSVAHWNWQDFWQRRRQVEISFFANQDLRLLLYRPLPERRPGDGPLCIKRLPLGAESASVKGRGTYRVSLTATPRGIEDVETGQRQ